VAISSLERRVIEDIRQEEVVELLQELIQQRSDFPPGDTRGVVEVIASRLREAGVPYQCYARREHQLSLVVTYPACGNGRCLLAHAHVDTVPAGEIGRWSVDPFSGERRQGRLYGRGSGDDKGSVAAQVAALLALSRAGVELKGVFQVAAVADEESGGEQGTRWLRQEGVLKPDALLVGEQTNNHVAIAERVACGIDLTVFGKSAHGAMPWAGENAVLKAAGALTWLRERLLPDLERRQHPYLPPPTLNIGKITGGIQWSIVPERCKVEMDRRLLPGESRDQAMEEIRQALDEYNELVEELDYELFSSGDVAPNINTPPDDPFVTAAQEALRNLCGESRPLAGYVQTSDGRWFAGDNIPIILFGPGDPALAHAADEFVEVMQVLEAARAIAMMAMRWR